MKYQRYDRAMVLDYHEEVNGYMTVTAAITRPGVFPYRRADGSIQFEAKLPDDIFSDMVIQSAKAKPVTDEHPPEPVTASNWQRYARGMSHTDSRVQGGMLRVTLTVTDPALIDRIKSGDQQEISIGFETDLVAEQGMYQGQKYDFKQTNIDINHIAITKQGRAGPEVAIRGDSAAYQIDLEEGGSDMATYKIDGKEFEVPSEVKSYMDAQQARLDAANSKAGDYDKLQGRYDALEADNTRLKTELDEAKKSVLTQDELDAAVTARTELLSGARAFLGDSFDFTGKTDREVKLAVIEKVKGDDFKADGKSDEYIDAFFDATVERSKQDGFSSMGSNHLQTTGSYSTDSQKEIENLRAKRLNLKDSKGAN
ncbi:DUF2213 domain-containing protein [Paenibacillus glucanolyticus]|uniref:DUF2213 domain-containing protein n=1 Tax=Paenibacillus glucanolyticus TaxID=59843 RepID=UPI0035DF964E